MTEDTDLGFSIKQNKRSVLVGCVCWWSKRPLKYQPRPHETACRQRQDVFQTSIWGKVHRKHLKSRETFKIRLGRWKDKPSICQIQHKWVCNSAGRPFAARGNTMCATAAGCRSQSQSEEYPLVLMFAPLSIRKCCSVLIIQLLLQHL